MKHVLIVDDEKPFLLSVRDGLTGYSDSYQVHLAYNGQEALERLRSLSIDLVVTDLKMPVMDGFQLLVAMNKEFPQVPVIVMTAFGTPDIEKRLKNAAPFHYLEKPLDLIALREAIDQGLKTTGRSLIRGITLATFLQLVKLENKTCTLKVKAKEGEGIFYLQQGDMIDAETSELRGEEAVYQIVCWTDPEIEMDAVCRRKDKIIRASVEHMLLEAYRLEDERKQTLREESANKTAPAKVTVPSAESNQAFAEELVSDLRVVKPTKPSLRAYLAQADEVITYAIFDKQGFLQEQHPDAAPLIKMTPTIILSAAALIGALLDQQFGCFEFRDDNNQRCVLCETGKSSVAVQLKAGSLPAALAAKLSAFDRGSSLNNPNKMEAIC